MRPDAAYQVWMNSHTHRDIRTEFADRVMERVYQREQRTRRLRFDTHALVDRLSVSFVAKVGLIKATVAAAGMLVGLGRFGFALLAFLGC